MRPAREKDVRAMSRATQRHSVSGPILAVLVIIAACLLWVQSRYDPGRWRALSETAPPGAEAAPDADAGQRWAVPEGLAAVSGWELYDPLTLSDKIDGKAELYLPAGFKQLAARRFSLKADSSRWMELFIYDMGSPAGAFAVFSHQARDGKQPLEITPDAYRSANGLFVAHGPYYLEIIASDDAAPVQSQMEALARAFVAAHPVRAAAPDERALFPDAGRVADSVALTAANAFGFDRFDQMYTARYLQAGEEATAFLSRRASAAQAAELARAFADFLTTYGGSVASAASTVVPEMQVIEVLGRFDAVFSRGAYLAGVHDAASAQQAVALAEALYHNLNGVVP